MFRISRRDEIAVESLLPLFAREITADPERHNPARREARIKEIKRYQRGFRALRQRQRAAADKKQDEELRTKLNGLRFDKPLRLPSFRVVKPAKKTQQLPIRLKPTPGRPDSAALTRGHRATTPKKRFALVSKVNTADQSESKHRLQGPSWWPRPSSLSEDSANRKLLSGQSKPSDLTAKIFDMSTTSTTRSKTLITSSPRPSLIRLDANAPNLLMGAEQSRPLAKAEAAPSLRTAKSHHSASTSSPTDQHNRSRLCDTKLSDRPSKSNARIHSVGINTPPDPESDVQASKQPNQQHANLGQSGLGVSLGRKDFEVKRICKRHFVQGSVVYTVHWKATWVPEELVMLDMVEQRHYVEAERGRWFVRKKLGSRVMDGIEQCRVRWASTREPAECLTNAKDAITAFEQTVNNTMISDDQQVRQRKVLTIRQSDFPRGSVLPQVEEEYAAAQQWIAATWPHIRPNNTLDLYPALYRIHMELAGLRLHANHGGKTFRCLMKCPQIRPLRWNEQYLASGRLFKYTRRRRATLLLQVTGEEDITRHCNRCIGDKLAPFAECIRSPATQSLWLNGACANCGTQNNAICPLHRAGKRHLLLHSDGFSSGSHNDPDLGDDDLPKTQDRPNDDDKTDNSDSCTDDESDDSTDDGADGDDDDDAEHGDSEQTQHHVHSSAAHQSPSHPSFAHFASDFAPDDIETDTLHPLSRHDGPVTAVGRAPTAPVAQISPVDIRQRRGRAVCIADIDRERITNTIHKRSSANDRPSFHAVGMNAAGSASCSNKGKKRAASLPPSPERPTTRAYMHPVSNIASDPVGGPTSSPGQLGQVPTTLRSAFRSKSHSSKTFINIRTHTKIKPDFTHPGCTAGLPCRDHSGRIPKPRDPYVSLKHNTLSPKRQPTIEEAEFILSQCDCYWAWKFSVIWARWCADQGGVANQERSQVEFLLLNYSDCLQWAAWACCPRGRPEVIVLDD